MTSSSFPRAGGILVPLAGLCGRYWIGDLGAATHAFVRWCGEAGLGWWQLLPVGPLGPGASPYSSSSAFAGEPLYLDLEALAAEGLLEPKELRAPREAGRGRVDYHRARAFKEPRLQRAYERWSRLRARRDRAFERFCADAAPWLDDFAAADADPLRARFLQHRFDVQWRALRHSARGAGVRLMGDAPIFVGLDSVDVAARPELFRLDRRGRPRVVTGVPPDDFTPDGQCWNHPHYAWAAHRAEGFMWWRARVKKLLGEFDALRIDHFIGLHHAYEIPAANGHAREGRWRRAPGRELLRALREDSPTLPLVAEDLGAATRGVVALREEFDLPGMRILQWGLAGDTAHLPHSAPENSVIYPATHDMDTCRGWYRRQDAETRARTLAYTGGRATEVGWDLWRLACASPAHTAIAQLQDLLNLGSAARTNIPGKARGNWSWRPDPKALDARLARRVHLLLEATDRLPEDRPSPS